MERSPNDTFRQSLRFRFLIPSPKPIHAMAQCRGLFSAFCSKSIKKLKKIPSNSTCVSFGFLFNDDSPIQSRLRMFIDFSNILHHHQLERTLWIEEDCGWHFTARCLWGDPGEEGGENYSQTFEFYFSVSINFKCSSVVVSVFPLLLASVPDKWVKSTEQKRFSIWSSLKIFGFRLSSSFWLQSFLMSETQSGWIESTPTRPRSWAPLTASQAEPFRTHIPSAVDDEGIESIVRFCASNEINASKKGWNWPKIQYGRKQTKTLRNNRGTFSGETINYLEYFRGRTRGKRWINFDLRLGLSLHSVNRFFVYATSQIFWLVNDVEAPDIRPRGLSWGSR